MKKTSLFLILLLCTVFSYAGSYGVLVNGTTYFAGEPAGEFEGFQQYLAHVQVSSGDQLQLYDAEYDAAWAVDLNTWSVAGFTRSGDHYEASVTGCYDFYIKLKYEQDELYIGNGSNCGEGEDVHDIYKGAVPHQCEAVMMQAFYNESAAQRVWRRSGLSSQTILQPELQLGNPCGAGCADQCAP